MLLVDVFDTGLRYIRNSPADQINGVDLPVVGSQGLPFLPRTAGSLAQPAARIGVEESPVVDAGVPEDPAALPRTRARDGGRSCPGSNAAALKCRVRSEQVAALPQVS